MGSKDKTALADRQKALEHQTRYFLPKRTYTMLRLDGKAFHSWCRGLNRPYDTRLIETMRETMRELCLFVEGAVLGYCQSDEITLLVANFNKENSGTWFEGNLAKLQSVSAGYASAVFNKVAAELFESAEIAARPLAVFDCRAWPLVDPADVAGNFIFRQRDATRNSVSMLAQAHFSSKQLHGVTKREMLDMLMGLDEPVNWNDQPASFKRGSICIKRRVTKPVTYTDKRTGEDVTLPAVERGVWSVEDAPVFTQSDMLLKAIPPMPQLTRERMLQTGR
jgi:tRNA(His) 5'-end guanylyltransferase